MNYTTEMGPKLTRWATDKIQRDYPEDIALLVGIAHGCRDGSGHGECFDYFVPATERGNELGREIHIGGINHDLYPRDWARCERTADFEDRVTFCLADGEILWARSPADAARFEALRQRAKDHLTDPEFMYRKALERLDEAMDIYRNMLFEERLCQLRMAAGHAFRCLLDAALYLNGKYRRPHDGHRRAMAAGGALPDHVETYYSALLQAKTAGELRSITHMLIQTARHFIAAHRSAKEEPVSPVDIRWLADWYLEMSLTWRRLRFFCGENNADAAFVDACTLQSECNDVAEEFGLPEMDILGNFDPDNLAALAGQATRAEEEIAAFLADAGQPLERHATFEEFLEKNP
ncbi:MAG: hypothetical protein LBJ11_06090 [Oscillospiraceae bacterium]|jgi:hypothetical protein|nr:hypothetical protein [Oscillospiraceae bacterium]